MDFTGMLMQDHYKAIADERARTIESARWRRAWFARKAVEIKECCGNASEACAPAAVPSNVPAGRA